MPFLTATWRVMLAACLLPLLAFAPLLSLSAAAADDRIPGLPADSLPVVIDEGLFRTEASLNRYLDECGYEVGFCATLLDQGRAVERFADREVCLASMVKVFCLTELFRRAEDGLDLDATTLAVPGRREMSLRKAADLMIGLSDNAATQALTEFLGREHVNAIPSLLGMEGLAPELLPTESRLHDVLDQRIAGGREAEPGLAQHGTARAMATYYERLHARQVISPAVSRDLLAFFARHPKAFSHEYREAFRFGGKGGNILWTRPPQHYSMMGWGLLLTDPHRQPVDLGDPIAVRQRGPLALCVWGEWFPAEMPPDEQQAFLATVTDSVIAILEAPQRAAKRIESASQIQQL